MSSHFTPSGVLTWRTGLPVLTGELVTLREPAIGDLRAIVSLLSLPDAARFGLDGFATETDGRRLIEGAVRDRLAGSAFTFAVTLTGARTVVGLIRARRLDPAFESADMDCTFALSSRGTGAFIDAARVAISFAFDAVAIHRLEVRAAVDNGRANGALRKLGAIHEGTLRGAARRGDGCCDQTLWALLKDDWGGQPVLDPRSVH